MKRFLVTCVLYSATLLSLRFSRDNPWPFILWMISLSCYIMAHLIRDHRGKAQLKIYIDLNDWWIGYFRGDNHHYVCVIPTVVIRWNRWPG